MSFRSFLSLAPRVALVLLLPALSACSHLSAAAAPRPAGLTHGTDFAALSIATLASHATDAAFEGKQVGLDASFERYSYTLGYGRSYQGYKLWDHAGHWLLCQNIYTTASVYPGPGPDASRDLGDGPAARLLSYGTFSHLEGKFHVAASSASHGGVFVTPASLDVFTIDGQATHALVRS